MRFIPAILLLIPLAACETEVRRDGLFVDTGNPGTNPTNPTNPGTTPTGPGCDARFLFTGSIVTIANTPLDFDDKDVDTPIDGEMTYNSCTIDELPDDADNGEYKPSGAFFIVNIGNVLISGPGTPTIDVQNVGGTDTFRWTEGTPKNPLLVDETQETALSFEFSIVDGEGDVFNDDSLPNPFPFTDHLLVDYPHTFAFTDGAQGTLLIQLDTIDLPAR